MCLLAISVKLTRLEVVKWAKIAINSGFLRLELVRARTFEQKGHRDLVIGSNERSWSIDVPFGHFGQKHPTRSCQIDKLSKLAVFIENCQVVKISGFHRKYI